MPASEIVPLAALLVFLILGAIALIRASAGDIADIVRTLLGRPPAQKPRDPGAGDRR